MSHTGSVTDRSLSISSLSTSPTAPTTASRSASYSWPSRQKVAIIGSGSAGIAALWALNRTHHDVYLYEAADRLGGSRAYSIEWKKGRSKTMVDAGAMVFEESACREWHVLEVFSLWACMADGTGACVFSKLCQLSQEGKCQDCAGTLSGRETIS